MMRFNGGYKYKSPSNRKRDKLRKEKFLAKFRRDPVLLPIPFLEPGQSPSPVTLGAPVFATTATAFTTQAEEMVDEMRTLHHKQDCLAQKTDQTETECKKVSNWVSDVLDQRVDVRCELERMEQDLKSKRESWNSSKQQPLT